MEMLAITVYTLLALYTGIKAVFSGVLVIRYLVLCVCVKLDLHLPDVLLTLFPVVFKENGIFVAEI
jgi:hypothetical protein